MSYNRVKLSASPLQISSSFKNRATALLWDSSIISFLCSSIFMAMIGMHEFLLGEYTGLMSLTNTSAAFLALIPIYYLVSITYYYFCFNRSQARTPTSAHFKSRVVSKDFVFNDDVREFRLSQSQILKRSLAVSINTMSCYLPNLIALVDPYSRGFADHLSDTISISDDEFYRIFTSKVSVEYQAFIDINTLETSSEFTELPIAA